MAAATHDGARISRAGAAGRGIPARATPRHRGILTAAIALARGVTARATASWTDRREVRRWLRRNPPSTGRATGCKV
jgi:hypothetical protein